MMKPTKDILMSRGYPEQAAIITGEKLDKLSGKFAIARDKWLKDSIETIIESNGFSTSGLMQRFKGMTYPAALLSIEWLEREPTKAKPIILRGIR